MWRYLLDGGGEETPFAHKTMHGEVGRSEDVQGEDGRGEDGWLSELGSSNGDDCCRSDEGTGSGDTCATALRLSLVLLWSGSKGGKEH